jgi:regulation of enolase protein 1 (concanavalin A-like superfamily)
MKRPGVLFAVFAAIAIATFAQPEPQIGSVLHHDSTYDISVIFSDAVDVGTLGNPDNYTLAIGSIDTLHLVATNQGVILNVQGLTVGVQDQLTIQGIQDLSGNDLPPATLDFTPTADFWAAIGANELGFPPDVVGFPTNSFDIFSGGVQQEDEYDDATFVGDKVNGDFEAKVRVEYVDPAGAGAKAGIMIREGLDEGKPRPLDPSDPAQAFSRYLELAVAAPQSALGEPGPDYQLWQRAVSPSFDTLSVTLTNNAAPAFTNAWLRVKRVGQLFTVSRGIDGQHWQEMGSATFDPPLATNVFVGLAFSPQNNDIPPGSGVDRKSFVAKFREYSLTTLTNTTVGPVRIQLVGDHAEVSWDGAATLETAPAVTGPWSNAPSQVSPVRVDFTEAMRFFRLRQ